MHKNTMYVILFLVIFTLISYKLYIYMKITTNTMKPHSWTNSDLIPTCSSTICGATGSQTRTIKCFDNDNKPVEDEYCGRDNKPIETRPCINSSINGQTCPSWEKISNIDIDCSQLTCSDSSSPIDTELYYCTTPNGCNTNIYNPITNLAGKPGSTKFCPTKSCQTKILSLTNVSSSKPFGNNDTISSLQIKDNTIVLPKNLFSGYFTLCISWYGSVAQNLIIPSLDGENISIIEGYNQDIRSSGVCSSAMIFLNFQITDPTRDSIIFFENINYSTVLPGNITNTTLLLIQTCNFLGVNPSDDPLLPKATRYSFFSVSNSNPLNAPLKTINQMGITLSTKQITIPGTNTRPFLFLITWFSYPAQTRRLPSISLSNISVVSTNYFNNTGVISSSTCGGYMLYYLTVFKITNNSSSGQITFGTNGDIGTTAKLHLLEI